MHREMKTLHAIFLLVLTIGLFQTSAANAQTKWNEEVPFTPDENGGKRTLINNLSGIGAVVRKSPGSGKIEITEVLPKNAAEEAGIKPKDVVLQIDDKKTDGMSTEQVVYMLRGNPDTKVEITIVRGSEAPRKFIVTRKPVVLSSSKKPGSTREAGN